MPMRVEDIAEEALALPSEARALLAGELGPSRRRIIAMLSGTLRASRRLHERRSGQTTGIPTNAGRISGMNGLPV